MGYHLGVDLGTTFSAAAAMSDGPPTMIGLGNRAMQIPSVLYFLPDGGVLVGEAAEHRSGSDPSRTVREFKRRIGDPVPILVAGRPFSAQALSGRLLRWVVEKSTEQLGERPVDLTLTYPANWGHFKIDLLRQVAMLADVDSVRACSEPEAAALQYASRTKVNVGDRIAVYDLGGGTFDVCVLEKTETGFQVPGRPEGIEHLGGIDFDEAVFQRVIGQLPPEVIEAAIDDAEQMPALARLRRDCVEAKEALSTDVDAVIPVALAGARTSIRLTRGEFEDIIRPALEDTIGATRRALRSAETEPSQLTAMVLVGGSSRIPLIAELLGNAFRCPIAVDTHPKNDVAMGAARAGALQDAGIVLTAPSRRRAPATAVTAAPLLGAAAATTAPATTAPETSAPATTAPERAMPTGPTRSGAPTGPEHLAPSPTGPQPVADRSGQRAPGSSSSTRPAGPPGDDSPTTTTAAPPRPRQSDGAAAPPAGPPGHSGPDRQKLRVILIAAAVAVLLAGIGTVTVLSLNGNNSVAGTAVSPSTTEAPPVSSVDLSPSQSASVDPSAAVSSSPAPSTEVSVSPVVELSPLGLPVSAPLPANQLIAPRMVNSNIDLYLIDASAGMVLSRLTTNTFQHRIPVISPDRRTVIYNEQSDSTRLLQVMAADGSGSRPLFATMPEGCVNTYRPDWNPVQPDLLALVCTDGTGKYSLRIVTVDGQTKQMLETGLPRIDDVAYSPDGKTLVFWGSDPSEFDGGSIYVMPADGSGPPVQLTNEKAGTDGDPAFSPDGQEIIFRRRMANGTSKGNFDIWAMNPDGSNLRQLTNHPAHDQDPAFSPDGTQIVFKSDRVGADASGASHLWIMDRDGANQRQLTPEDGSRDESGSAWGPR